MALGTENGLSVADIAAVTDRNNGNCNGWGGGFGEMLIAMIMLFLFPMFFGGFGGFGGGMWGGMGGWGNGGMVAAANGALTRADICSEFNFNGLENSVRATWQGLCDGFYAMNTTMLQGFNGVTGAVSNLGTTVMQGFSQAELSRCNQQAALMQQLYQMGYNQQDCCCKTQNAIERTNYDAAIRSSETNRLIERGFCDTNYNAATNTTAIIQNAHNDTDRVLARLDAMESSRKDERIAEQAAQIQALQLAASQAQQNNAIGAMISASEATILRRTGAECPTPAYVVQPPTPVNFPTNCCGTVNFGGNGCGNGCGC